MGIPKNNTPPVREQILSVIGPGEELTSMEIKRRIRECYGIYGCGNVTGYLKHLHADGTLKRAGFKFFLYRRP